MHKADEQIIKEYYNRCDEGIWNGNLDNYRIRFIPETEVTKIIKDSNLTHHKEIKKLSRNVLIYQISAIIFFILYLIK